MKVLSNLIRLEEKNLCRKNLLQGIHLKTCINQAAIVPSTLYLKVLDVHVLEAEIFPQNLT